MELHHKEHCTAELDMGRGCRFCSCDGETTASVCEGCFKLHATDWLEEYPQNLPADIFEVRFKNTRRGYYKNVNSLDLKKGDIVAVEASPGHDIGIISLTGDIVARQMKRVGFSPQNGEFKKIYRKAKPYDIEKWQEAIAMEHETMIRSRQIAAEMGLNMKIGDVEFQGDKIKAIFYYIADERVDFRELIKVFAEQFRIRVEMKQIGARQEAGRIGGLGSCGRELCCASWISSFVSVTTNAARTQEISLNPQKLAGQCSKLKCCMIYELDSYIDARKDFPKVNQPLQAIDGEYYLVKNDILAHTMSFSTSPNAMVGITVLPVSRVKEILELNRSGKKVDSLAGYTDKKEESVPLGFVNVIGEESITRFDSVKGDRKSRSRKNKKSGERREGASSDTRQEQNRGQRAAGEKPRSQGGRDSGQRRRPNGVQNSGQDRTEVQADTGQGGAGQTPGGQRQQDGKGQQGRGNRRPATNDNNRPRHPRNNEAGQESHGKPRNNEPGNESPRQQSRSGSNRNRNNTARPANPQQQDKT